jgi:ketosteroid isomerase-like protein
MVAPIMTASKSSEVSSLASPDEIEHQFYEALRHGDIERLMAVWSDEEEVTCVHPGGPRLVGVAAIRSAFDAIFNNGVINVHPEKIRRVSTTLCAVHSVLERIQVITPEGPHIAWVMTTNVYIKGIYGWRLVVHHASPGTPREMSDINETPSVLH